MNFVRLLAGTIIDKKFNKFHERCLMFVLCQAYEYFKIIFVALEFNGCSYSVEVGVSVFERIIRFIEGERVGRNLAHASEEDEDGGLIVFCCSDMCRDFIIKIWRNFCLRWISEGHMYFKLRTLMVWGWLILCQCGDLLYLTQNWIWVLFGLDLFFLFSFWCFIWSFKIHVRSVKRFLQLAITNLTLALLSLYGLALFRRNF